MVPDEILSSVLAWQTGKSVFRLRAQDTMQFIVTQNHAPNGIYFTLIFFRANGTGFV